jgi:hypothetical protein
VLGTPDKRPRAWDVVVLLVLVAIYAAGYATSATHTDTADELLRAWEISRGIRFPLEGPPLGQVLHLGPIWFYLMSLPLFVHASWLVAAIYVGVLCGLKFPLAYWCGTRLLDRRFGLFWAVALFAPGWPTLEQLVFLNPNAVATMVLALLAISIALAQRPTMARFLGAGCLLALAAHVHPTSAPAALFLLPGLVRARREGVSVVGALGALALPIVVSIAPYVVGEAMNGYPDALAARRYVGGEITLAGALNAPFIEWHYFAGGAVLLLHRLAGVDESVARMIGIAVVAVCGVLALLPLIAATRESRRVYAFALLACVVFTAWVGMLRRTTPMQFTWVLEPSYMAVVALGLWSLARVEWGKVVAAVACVGIVAAHGVSLALMARMVYGGEGVLGSEVLDIRGTLPLAVYRDVWFPADAHRLLGVPLCALPPGASLHGPLAYIADKDLGLDMLFACGDRKALHLAASAAPAHLAGMSRRFWQASGASPECWAGSLGLTSRVTVPVSLQGVAITQGETYLPRKPSGAAWQSHTYTFTTHGDALVLVTNVLGGYEGFGVRAASVDGKPVAPIASNDLSALFKAVPGGDHAWSIEVAATQPLGIDVAAIETVSPTRPDCGAHAS